MRILAVSGSLGPNSTNSALLRAAAEVSPAPIELSAAPSIGDLPHFDPALAETPPESVRTWSDAVFASDAVLIATPEYAFSLPGVLKNALDWLVGTGALHGRAVAVLSASSTNSGGANAQQAIAQTLRGHGARIVATLQVPGAKPKFVDGRLVDEPTRAALAETMDKLATDLAAPAHGG